MSHDNEDDDYYDDIMAKTHFFNLLLTSEARSIEELRKTKCLQKMHYDKERNGAKVKYKVRSFCHVFDVH